MGELRPSGMERMLVAASAHFAEQGVSATILGQGASHPYAVALEDSGYDVVLLPQRVSSVAGIRALRSLVHERDIDVVHIHTESDYLRTVLAIRAASGSRLPVVRTVHNVFAATGVWRAKRYAQARLADPLVAAVLAPSDDVAENERSYARTATVIWNWVDDAFFALSGNRGGDEHRRPTAVIVGNCSPIKRHELALEAVLSAGYDLIHLGGEEGADTTERRTLDALERDGRLLMRGVHDTTDALRRGDVFLMPSRHEGMGVALAEALVAGVPALVSKAPGLRWAARFPHVRMLDDDDWASALLQALPAATPSAVTPIDFSAARGADQYAALYRNVTVSRRRAARDRDRWRAPRRTAPGARRRRVAIVQPWLPQYREPFYRALIARAEAQGVGVDVFYGDPPPEWRERKDTVAPPYATHLPTRVVPVAGRSLLMKRVRGHLDARRYDLLVLEQAVRNVETYRLLLGRTPLAFWGHGRTYTVPVTRGQEAVKQWLTRRGTWFFAYTPGGADAVVTAGFPADRVSVVMNSVDTTELGTALTSLSPEDVRVFRAEHRLQDRTAVFLGGLDEAKRLPFLLEAARLAHEQDSRFRLVVGGAGEQRALIEAAAREHDHIRYLGPAHGRTKALALASAQVIAMPGRVGLVAVDSFVAGRPVVTTSWPWHAPEFEYLEHDSNAVIATDDVTEYARELLTVLSDHPRLDRLQASCLRSAEEYGTAPMADRFLDGLLAALERLA
ncbi:glycosyltransferase family 4 protein [Georgenia sp. 10Sc9-8]|uniref:D-inositol 3-phosphate glycosyltransferase n=1 Tax=Georgenia halotolerans TaxID=3028317 RepID=A0ABT5TXX8_9MICO|nr:glycosyltransferase family 4 protein [Georgenia halotolerans]